MTLGTAGSSTTLRDVAFRAGVSLSTASRVLNGASGVSDDLAGRVRLAAGELDYHPNIAARSLRVSRTMTFGLLFHRLESPYALEALQAIDAASRERGYSLLVTNASGDTETARTLLRRLFERRVDGLFVYRPTGVREALRPFQDAGIPILSLFARGEGCEDIPLVTYQPGPANGEMIDRLHALGHRSFTYFATPVEIDGRTTELAQIGIDRGMKFHLQRVPDGRDDAAMAAALAEIERLPQPPTAILARYRHIASLLSVLKQLGRRVPDDYSLVSYGDSEWLTVFEPNIGVIQGDGRDLGRTALRMMHSALDGHPIPEVSYSAGSQFLARESVAAPRA